jgi:hypothetical protein
VLLLEICQVLTLQAVAEAAALLAVLAIQATLQRVEAAVLAVVLADMGGDILIISAVLVAH